MKGPPRLLTDSDLALRAVLEAGCEDRPEKGAQQRALIAMGAGSAVGLAVKSAAAGSTTVAASTAKTGSALTLAKWVGSGALGGLVVCGAVVAPSLLQEQKVQKSERHEAAARNVATPTEVTMSSRELAEPTPERTSPKTEQHPSKIRKKQLTPAAASLATQKVATAPSENPANLGAEVKLLDQARRDLKRGKPGAALASLHEYQRKFPRGRLFSEALVLRLDALVRLGQREQARQIADRYLKMNPRAPHGPRIRKLVGAPAKEK